MTAYNESLSRAGVLLAGEGLKPSAEGVRYHYTGGEATVTDGPFAETKELVAGFTTIQARSLDEAVAWARRGRRRDAGGPPGARARPLVRHSGPRPTPVCRHLERSSSAVRPPCEGRHLSTGGTHGSHTRRACVARPGEFERPSCRPQ